MKTQNYFLPLLIFCFAAGCKKTTKDNPPPAPRAIHSTASILVFNLDTDQMVWNMNATFSFEGNKYSVDLDRIYDEDRNGSVEIINTDLLAPSNEYSIWPSDATAFLVDPRLPNTIDVTIDSFLINDGKVSSIDEVYQGFNHLTLDITHDTRLLVDVNSSAFPELYVGHLDVFRAMLNNFCSELNDSDTLQAGKQPKKFLVMVR